MGRGHNAPAQPLTHGDEVMPSVTETPAPIKRKRGRPRKIQVPVVDAPTVTQYEELNKPEPPKPTEFPIPSGPIPPGWRMVFNRLPERYVIEFDSQPQIFGPHEFKLIPADVAPHICGWSVIQLPAQGPPVRALVMDGKKGYGMPFKTKAPIELIDRAGDPRTKVDGVPVKPTLIYI